MEQLYRWDRHVLGHLDSNEFRLDTRVKTKKIREDYFNMIDSNLSIFYCSDIRVNYHKIASISVQRDYNTYRKIIDINNNIKTIEIVEGNGRNGLISKLMYVQSVLKYKNLDNISKKNIKKYCQHQKNTCRINCMLQK